MSNNEPSAPNTETRHSSRPYPARPGQFPVPPAPENNASARESQRDDPARTNNENVPIGMLSPYFRDHILPQETFPLTEASEDGTEIINFQHHGIPGAPSMEDISADQQIPVPLPIGFKTIDIQMDSVPSEPPPSYNQLFNTEDVDLPKNIQRGTSMDTITTIVPRNRTNTNRSEMGSSTETRTIVLSRTHHVSTNRYQNPTENELNFSNDNSCCALTLKMILAFLLLLSFYYIVKKATRRDF